MLSGVTQQHLIGSLDGMLQQARWSRFADGADEVHQMRTAELLMKAFNDDGSINAGVGGLPI